jgi:Flp pilus assembly protein TadG
MNPTTSATPSQARTLPTGVCPKSRHLRGKSRRLNAQVTVEFAFICLPFFAILFAIIDYAQIYFYENSLQNAMREAARFATAGRVIEMYHADGSVVYETNAGVAVPQGIMISGTNEASRNQCIKYWFLTNCLFAISTNNITITSQSTLPGVPPKTTTNSFGDNSLSPATPGPGNANDYVQITAVMTVRTITPLMTYLGGYSHQGYFEYPVHVSAIVKNEPALLNFKHIGVYDYETNHP